ncbi:MAG: hypothetical protein JJ878_17175, partial [Alphaproteobacteria bacterium]|nr:hypothetical protein [Alphaproteobacteria bacterium]
MPYTTFRHVLAIGQHFNCRRIITILIGDDHPFLAAKGRHTGRRCFAMQAGAGMNRTNLFSILIKNLKAQPRRQTARLGFNSKIWIGDQMIVPLWHNNAMMGRTACNCFMHGFSGNQISLIKDLCRTLTIKEY